MDKFTVCEATYLAASRSRTLQVGMTRDLGRRMFKHKWKQHEGLTAKYDPLVWFESYQDVDRTRKAVEGLTSGKETALINKTNPVERRKRGLV